MILKQKLYEEDGVTVLRNTIDCKDAADMARDVTQEGGRGKNMIPLGFIPPEYWMFDPWLIAALRAQREGDRAEYMRLVKKFFEVHPTFAVHKDHTRRVWSGGVTND
jgi:hypothetical protein